MGKNKKTNDALEALLNEAGASKVRMSKKKKIITASTAVVLVAAIVTGSVIIIRTKKNKNDEPTYREYTVTRGDITTGQTESSVITLNKESITFPVGAEVLEVYVKSGTHVKEGDPLVKMDIDDINSSLSDYEDDIDSAAAEVENAEINRKSELAAAKQSRDKSLLEGEQADDKYSQTVAQADLDLADAENAVDEAQDKYDDTYSKSLTFSDDYKTLSCYESNMDSAEESANIWSDKLTEYNELKSGLGTIESQIKQLADVSGLSELNALESQLKSDCDLAAQQYGENSSEYRSAVEKYNAFENNKSTLRSLLNEKNELENKLSAYDITKIESNASSYKKLFEEAKEKYNGYKTEFTEKYGQVSSETEMKSALSSAKASLDKAKLNLEKQRSNYSATILQAKQTMENSKLAAKSAERSYTLKKIELDQKVKEAKKKYDELVDELEEIKESIGNNGIITAPCDGIVSSLSVEEGDEVTISGNDSMFGSSSAATLMTITGMSDAYVSISISEDEILNVSLDQDASVSLAAFPDETFDGVVDSITVEGATIGAATVTYTVNVYFTQNSHDIYDGMSADVTLIEGQAKDVLYTSKQAVTTKDGSSYVMLKGEDGTGVETAVRTGFTDGQFVEIISGVKEGDILLAESAIGAGASSKNSGKSSGNMPDMGNFDFSDMPSDFPGGMGGAAK